MQTVKILCMGTEGDGVGAAANSGSSGASKFVYVPFTLPGEVAEADLQPGGFGLLRKLDKASPERQQALCRYFEQCGGCVLQHWQDAPYHEWKRGLIADAFRKAGIELRAEQIAKLFSVKAGTRRRIILTAQISGGGVSLGFNRLRSHEIIAIETCPVAQPELTAALPFVRALLARLKVRREAFHVVLTAAENGLDMALQDIKPVLAEDEKLRLAEFLTQRQRAAGLPAEIMRITSDNEIIISRAEPVIHFGEVIVGLPSGGFLQAAAAAEQYMAELAAEALKKAKNILDLFSGCGSFAFRLAVNANVHAVEYDEEALSCLERAAAKMGEKTGAEGIRLKKIAAERRDLFRRPLTARELAPYDGLVFDPPRAGAEAQVKEIAKSAVKNIAAVSCNPVTLARDAAILLAGGYELKKITPIDQFLWSPHIEAVAHFTKRPAKKGWKL